ncbi:MAG: hypothetical protein M3O50_14115 [Myxococcota bacterium]|nr:hypothetical protein [Myxococcota bacterium]
MAPPAHLLYRGVAIDSRSFAFVTGEKAPRSFAALLYASCLTYAGVTLWHYPMWTVDDAYIVFRYAKHLVEHGQLTWNVGGDPVEGYTGIALPLLVACGIRFGIAPEHLTRAVGIAAFFFAAWTVRDNQRRLGVPEPVRAYVTGVALIFAPLFAHATSGLETLLFAGTLGVSFGALLACNASPTPAAQALLWMEVLLLSFIRPEGMLFAAVFGVALAVRLRRNARGLGVATALALGIFALPYGSYFAWRVIYYGRLLPNTYYAKALSGGFDPDFMRAAASLLDLLMPLLVAGVVTIRATASARATRLPIAASLVAIGLLVVQYSRSALIMGYLYRFQVHVFYVVLPLIGALLAHAMEWGELRRRFGRAKGGMLAGLVGLCLVAFPVEAVRANSDVRAMAQRYVDIDTEQDGPIAEWLRDHLSPLESVAYWVDAGMMPFVADDHTAIDFGKLNDEFLARAGLSRHDIADYFFSKSPGALVLTSDHAMPLSPQHDGDIVTSDPRFGAYERRLTECSPEYPGSPCEILFLRAGAQLR